MGIGKLQETGEEAGLPDHQTNVYMYVNVCSLVGTFQVWGVWREDKERRMQSRIWQRGFMHVCN